MTLVTADATLAGVSRPTAEPAEPFAPGWPGVAARWTSSAKTGIGTAVSRDSRVWFTLSHGGRGQHGGGRRLQGFAGTTLRLETLAPCRRALEHGCVECRARTATRDTTLGVHVADLGTRDLRCGDHVHLTFYRPEAGRWEGIDFRVCIE
jgi:hypothetical protein